MVKYPSKASSGPDFAKYAKGLLCSMENRVVHQGTGTTTTTPRSTIFDTENPRLSYVKRKLVIYAVEQTGSKSMPNVDIGVACLDNLLSPLSLLSQNQSQ